jgi:hypothetical protein
MSKRVRAEIARVIRQAQFRGRCWHPRVLSFPVRSTSRVAGPPTSRTFDVYRVCEHCGDWWVDAD